MLFFVSFLFHDSFFLSLQTVLFGYRVEDNIFCHLLQLCGPLLVKRGLGMSGGRHSLGESSFELFGLFEQLTLLEIH
jgi:hypothetical protein